MENMAKEFVVLYTGQKLKKAKTWHDGILKHDGKSTKAMLYDEKGGRLDSIHIKVEDISMGEQLESDRYFILVESMKTCSDRTDEKPLYSNPVTAERPSTQKRVLSQARCAGLKRKKTGFMPPRLIKQPRQEDQDSQEGSPLRLHNRIYPTQSLASTGNSQMSPSGGEQQAPLLQNVSDKNVNNGQSENVRNTYSNNSNRNSREGCHGLYSSIASRKSTCESHGLSSFSPLSLSPAAPLSPWSVYGSRRNNSTNNVSPGRDLSSPKDQYGQPTQCLGPKQPENEIPVKPLVVGVAKSFGKDHGIVGSGRNQSNIHSLENKLKEKDKQLGIGTPETLDSGQQMEPDNQKPVHGRSMKAIMELLRKNKQSNPVKQSTELHGSFNRYAPSVYTEPLENDLKRTPSLKYSDFCDIKDVESLSQDDTEHHMKDSFKSLQQQRKGFQHDSPYGLDNKDPRTTVLQQDMTLYADTHTDDECTVQDLSGGGEENKENIDIVSSHRKKMEFESELMGTEVSKPEEVGYMLKGQVRGSSLSKAIANESCSLDDQTINIPSLCNPDTVPDNSFSQLLDETQSPVISKSDKDGVDSITEITTGIVSSKPIVNIESKDNVEDSDVCFSISYSPLSHASLSDSEDITQDEIGGKPAVNDLEHIGTIDDNQDGVLGVEKIKSYASHQPIIKGDSQHETDQIDCADTVLRSDLIEKDGEVSTNKDIIHGDILKSSIENVGNVDHAEKENIRRSRRDHEETCNIDGLDEEKETSKDEDKLTTDVRVDVKNIFTVKEQHNDNVAKTMDHDILISSNQIKGESHDSKVNKPWVNSVETDEKASCLSNESQDTMEFSCDTVYDDSQNTQLGLPRTLGHTISPDNTLQGSRSVKLTIVGDVDGGKHLDEDVRGEDGCKHFDEDSDNHFDGIVGYVNDGEHFDNDVGDEDGSDNFDEDVGHVYGDKHFDRNVALQRQNAEGPLFRSKNEMHKTNWFRDETHRCNSDSSNLFKRDTVNEVNDFAVRKHWPLHEDGRVGMRQAVERWNQNDNDCDDELQSDSGSQCEDKKYLAYSQDVNCIQEDANIFERRVGTLQGQPILTDSGFNEMSRILRDSRVVSPKEARPVQQSYMMAGVKFATASRETKETVPPRSYQGHENSFNSPACFMDTTKPKSPIADSTVPDYICEDDYSDDTVDLIYKQLYKPRPMYNQVKVDGDNGVKGQGQSQRYWGPFARSSLQQYRSKVAENRRLESLAIHNKPQDLINDSYELSPDCKNVPILCKENFEKQNACIPKGNADSFNKECSSTPKAITDLIDKKFEYTPMSDSLSFLSDESIDYNVRNFIKSDLKKELMDGDQNVPIDFDKEKADIKEEVIIKDQYQECEEDLNDDMYMEHDSKEIVRTDTKTIERSKWDQYVPEQAEEEIDLNKFKRKEVVNRDFSVVESIKFTKLEEGNGFQSLGWKHPSDKAEGDKTHDSDVDLQCSSDDNIVSGIRSNFPVRNKVVDTGRYTSSDAAVVDDCDTMVASTSLTVCDVAESCCSTDSLELLMAVEDAERDMVKGNSCTTDYDSYATDNVTKSNHACDGLENDDVDDKVTKPYFTMDVEPKTEVVSESKQPIRGEKENDTILHTSDHVFNGETDYKNTSFTLQQTNENPDVLNFNNKASFKRNSVNLFKRTSMGNINGPLQNKVPSKNQGEAPLDDSLDLSLSLDIQDDSWAPVSRPSFLQQPALRAAWNPQQQKVNKERNMIQEKSDKVKPTFRCLKILARSKLSPSVECTLPDEIQCNDSAVDNRYDKQTVDDDLDKNSNSGSPQQHLNRLVGTNNILASYMSDMNRTPNKSIHSEGRALSSRYISPVICQQMNKKDKSIHQVSRPQIGNKFKPPSMIQTKSPSQPWKSPTLLNTTIPHQSPKPHVGLKLNCTELCFPGCETVEYNQGIARQVVIPESFSSVHQYKQVLTSAVLENLNSMLFEISKRYHQAMSRVDTSGYTNSAVKSVSGPSVLCKCGTPAKILSVRKDGPNQGRQFYGCSKNSQQRCKFFQWADGNVSQFNAGTGNKRKISDGASLGYYLKDQHVHFYPECQLIRKSKENIHKYFKRPKWERGNHNEDTVQKKQLFLKLPRKGHSSLYAKDDIWIISKDLRFHPSTTFLARSTFYGPLASNEVEVEPLYGYSPSNWTGEAVCHGLLAGNATSELNCLENIKEHLTAQSPPILTHLLNRDRQNIKGHGGSGFSVPKLVSLSSFTDHGGYLRRDVMDDMVVRYIEAYRLNADQTEALRRVSHMFCQEKADSVDNVLLLHGVFGAGKSFLLSVMVLFLVEVFQTMTTNRMANSNQVVWKLLISSTTNVAVDRILQCVLELGFEDFVRVGSVKKIAKPILPYSIHASGTDNQELKDLQEMLRSHDLTQTEKSHVRQSIEKHRHGENKKKLGAVKVVGVTCASCSVASLKNMQFPVVFLDECSQMTEPSSLLPIARFGCQKLLLVGDPKQLDPTIEGAKAVHNQGLEQTMFDRLIKMGSIPTILRTQYRCHPWISDISNQLFYGEMLINGVTEEKRQPLLDAIPTICFYDVDKGQECCEGGGSVYNEQEAQFVVFLLQVLTSAGIESGSIGVITLYRSQMSRIMDLIVSCGDDSRLKGIQVSTVDAFQGGERDIIILSCVRTKSCGFIDNDKRTNVALTRAKHHLLIVGHYKNLSNNSIWGKVLQHCNSNYSKIIHTNCEASTTLTVPLHLRKHKDGVQSADKSRKQLELYMEGISTQASVESTESHKSQQKPRKSRTKGGKHCKTNTAKQEITSPGHNESDDQSQTSSVDGSTIQQSNAEIVDPFRETVVDVVDNSTDELEGDQLEQQRQTLCADLPSDSITLSRQRLPQHTSRLKYSDRLQSDWFEEDPTHDSDEDLPAFDY